MKPRIIALLVAVLVLMAVGAYVLSDYKSDSHSAQAMAQLEQTQQSTTLAPSAADISQSGSGTTSTGTAVVELTPQPSPAVEKPADEPLLRFIAVGDIMLGRGVGMRLQKYGSYDRAFANVSAVLKQGDVVFANLESPLTKSTHSLDPKRKIVLKAKPEAVGALTGAGFNLISIANNHMMDYYETGLFDTMSILSTNQILFAGSGKNIDEARKPAIIVKNGLKIGLLAYSDMAELVFAGDPYLRYSADKDQSGISPRKYEAVIEDVRKLRGQVDLLAVSLHWGAEDSFTVSDEQREFAHKLIDEGVDVILGHHPHQFQGIEMYKGKPVFYSMGNFLFDQNESENMESFIIDMKYKGTELSELSAIPVRILDKSTVEIQTGTNAANIIARQTELCRELGTPPGIVNDRLVFLK
jgi:poly-gamma-glutamate capsule biosynthesis protein CapA/YwtB (metallophosphatase superfamily)